MTVRMFSKLLCLLTRKFTDHVFLITDGNRQYVLDDIYADDKNPFVYLKIRGEN